MSETRDALIAVDIGNTTVSLGCLIKENGGYDVIKQERFPTADGNKPAVIERSLQRLMEGAEARLADDSSEPAVIRQPLPDIGGLVISSVVPKVTETVKQTIAGFFSRDVFDNDDFFEEEAVTCSCNRNLIEAALASRKQPLDIVEITDKSLTGLIFRSIDMSTLGHDRIVDATWAAANVPLPAVTVDMGTATTFNVIDEGGVFMGGMICAGIRTGLWGLNQRTAALPIPKERQPGPLIGKKTVDCLLSGAYNGSAAMIDGLVARVEEELGRPVSLVMTGGHAITVQKLCRHEVIYEPNLLMKGLAFLYEKNARGLSD